MNHVACRFHSRNAVTSFFFWVKSWALPGIGMFCEVISRSPAQMTALLEGFLLVIGLHMECAVQSYFIFSIGNITPIFQETYKV